MILISFVFLALLFEGFEAKPKCINTIYVIPMLVEESIPSDFTQFRAYLQNCSGILNAGSEKTNIAILSLENQTFESCSVWSDCEETLSGDVVNNEALTIKPHKTYDIGNFIMDNLKGDRYCLKNAVLQIITNIRCQMLDNYPMLKTLLYEEINEFSSFIMVRKLDTTIFWYNFDYIGPSDNIGCDELYGLKKRVGSKLSVVYSQKSNLFMNDLTDQCAA